MSLRAIRRRSTALDWLAVPSDKSPRRIDPHPVPDRDAVQRLWGWMIQILDVKDWDCFIGLFISASFIIVLSWGLRRNRTEIRCLSPCGKRIQTLFRLALATGVFGVHINTVGTSIDL